MYTDVATRILWIFGLGVMLVLTIAENLNRATIFFTVQ